MFNQRTFEILQAIIFRRLKRHEDYEMDIDFKEFEKLCNAKILFLLDLKD